MKYRLILFDVDSTLIKQEVIDLLAEKSGHGREVQQITARAMAGEIDFSQALLKRVSLLEGLPESVFDEVISEISFAEGFDELFSFLRKNGFLVGAVSGGFHNVLDKLFAQLQLDFLKANVLEVVDGKLTGKITAAPVDRMAKARALREFAALHKVDVTIVPNKNPKIVSANLMLVCGISPKVINPIYKEATTDQNIAK